MFLRRRTIPWFLGSAVFTIAAFSALVVSADSPSSGEISLYDDDDDEKDSASMILEILSGAGCCSGHGGVRGCIAGKALCGDGFASACKCKIRPF